MRFANFCTTCGEPLTRKGWRSWLRGPLCDDCAARGGNMNRVRPLLLVAMFVISAFALGRYLRPAPPPLIIHRAANSPLSDLPINLDQIARRTENNSNRDSGNSSAPVDDTVYLCGARTQKGTPCRRRVHFAGERCYQHQGRPAMVPLEKLTIKAGAAKPSP
jgi:hypothetical protein